jgi:hypothetical protein
MSNIVRIVGGRNVEQFDPERYRLNDAALDFTIDHAKRLRDWRALEEAVDLKIEEQHKFVAWRESTIRGVGQPQKNCDRTVTKLSDQEVTDLSGITKKQAQRMAARLADPEKYRSYLLGAEYCNAAFLVGPENVRGAGGTGEFERYTPALYVEAARRVLGAIDLDPASCEAAQETVQATKFLTARSAPNGLECDWHGRVWLNPPYSRELGPQFISKLIAEYAARRVTAAIMLTNNCTDTEWFSAAAEACNAICFTRGRIGFIDDAGNEVAPTQGKAFFYLGKNIQRFGDLFRDVGHVWVPFR